MIASQMAKLSVTDREKVYMDVHGISDCVAELQNLFTTVCGDCNTRSMFYLTRKRTTLPNDWVQHMSRIETFDLRSFGARSLVVKRQRFGLSVTFK